jgi:hypothetical protein
MRIFTIIEKNKSHPHLIESYDGEGRKYLKILKVPSGTKNIGPSIKRETKY